MRSIIALALIFSATFAGANILLNRQSYQALTTDGLRTIIAERAYVSNASAKAPRARPAQVDTQPTASIAR